jgi:hypothetical protein
MAKRMHVPIDQLVRGWLNLLEVEFINLQQQCRAAHHTEQSAFTEGIAKAATIKLATLREIRQRIPKAWKRAYTLEE